MSEKTFICLEGAEGRITEKKSVFICRIKPVENEEEAAAFLDGIRKEFWDANHHCYAYTIGDTVPKKKFSDDGEPSQTAGKPILDMLEGAELKNVCAVVTRYFGGTLLGTGGLVRAYQSAVREALKGCRIAEKIKGEDLSFIVDYDLYEKIRRLAQDEKVSIIDTVFGEKVTIVLATGTDNVDNLIGTVTELSGGRAILNERKERDILL